MTESQKLAVSGMAALRAAGVPQAVIEHALEVFMQAGYEYCLEQSKAIATDESQRNSQIIANACKSFHGSCN